jgi:hypothetical protein
MPLLYHFCLFAGYAQSKLGEFLWLWQFICCQILTGLVHGTFHDKSKYGRHR